MNKILLPHGKYAYVSDRDYEWLNQYRWCINSQNFVMRIVNKKTITMHRLIMNPPRNMQVDHINGDRLDNRRENLRICTQSQNCTNRASVKSKSGYKGVSKHWNKWRAVIKVNQKKIHLGLFDTKEEAALAYNKAAKVYFGDFARLNSL